MANKTIADYSAASAIDPINDYLLIEPSGNTLYKKINRNTILGVTGTPADISTVQTISNKILDNTNTITVRDGVFTLQDDVDLTKQSRFQLSAITTGTTRTLTIPDATGTITLNTATQTLTNKTITAPAITGGTIDNTTITVDAISGHTSATIVTVANLQISNGVLNTANAVTATSIADGAIQPKALVAGTGSGWSWQSWTPIWANFTPGNGVNSSKYMQVGKTVFFRVVFVLGSSSAMGSAPTFTLPVTSITPPSTSLPIGWGEYNNTSGAYPAMSEWLTTTTSAMYYWDTNGNRAAISSSAPGNWATNWQILIQGQYEVA